MTGNQPHLGASQELRGRRFLRISEAYKVLSSPERRTRYDADASYYAHANTSRSQSIGSTGQSPPGRQQNHQRAQQETRTSNHQTQEQHDTNEEYREPTDWELYGAVSIGTVIVAVYMAFLLAPDPFDRIWRSARKSNDPDEVRRITFELAPLFFRQHSRKPMMRIGQLGSPPSDPELAVESRIWMRNRVKWSDEGRELVWIGVDMDQSECGMNIDSLLHRCKSPESTARFRSVLERRGEAMGHLKSSGNLKEMKTLTVVALREFYLLYEYNSVTGKLELGGCGEWIIESQGSVVGFSELSPSRLSFTNLWRRESFRSR